MAKRVYLIFAILSYCWSFRAIALSDEATWVFREKQLEELPGEIKNIFVKTIESSQDTVIEAHRWNIEFLKSMGFEQIASSLKAASLETQTGLVAQCSLLNPRINGKKNEKKQKTCRAFYFFYTVMLRKAGAESLVYIFGTLEYDSKGGEFALRDAREVGMECTAGSCK